MSWVPDPVLRSSSREREREKYKHTQIHAHVYTRIFTQTQTHIHHTHTHAHTHTRTHKKMEAALTASVLRAYHKVRKLSSDKMGKEVFVVTPHHAQRRATDAALSMLGLQGEEVLVETVEKMQGQERDMVVAMYGYMCPDQIGEELDFLFDARRLNVSLTRAKAKAILITSDVMLRPGADVFGSTARVAGLQYLAHFVAICKDPRKPKARCLELRIDASVQRVLLSLMTQM